MGADLRFGLISLGFGSLECGLTPLQVSRADKALVTQLLEACVIGLCLVQIHLGGEQGRAGTVLPEFQILRIELGEHLPSLYGLPKLDESANQFSADAKTETRLSTGSHLASEFKASASGIRGHRQRSNCPDGVWSRLSF